MKILLQFRPDDATLHVTSDPMLVTYVGFDLVGLLAGDTKQSELLVSMIRNLVLLMAEDWSKAKK